MSPVIRRRDAIARTLYCASFFVITWDRLAVVGVAGFHLKLAYFLLLAAGVVRVLVPSDEGFSLGRDLRAFAGLIRRPPWTFLLALILLCAVLVPVADRTRKAVGYTLWGVFDLTAFVGLGVALFAGEAAGESRRAWRDRLLTAWTGGIALAASVAVLDFLAWFAGAKGGVLGGFQPKVMRWGAEGLPRPFAFSYEPSYLAFAICFALPLVVTRLLRTRGRCRMSALGLPIMLAGLFVTYSRTGFLLFGLQLCLIAALNRDRAALRALAALIGLIAAAGVISILLLPPAQRAGIYDNFIRSLWSGSDESGRGRLHGIIRGFEIGFSRPLGAGPGGALGVWLEETGDPAAVEDFPQQVTPVTSVWPEVLLEEGVAGLALCIAFFVSFTLGFRGPRPPPPDALFVAWLPVAAVGLWFMPTLWRADLWSLVAVCAIHLESRGDATGTAPERQ